MNTKESSMENDPTIMQQRTWVDVFLDSFSHNIKRIQQQVGKKTKLLAVVKADAYGHGAVTVAKYLEQEKTVTYLAVSSIDEAEELRLHNIRLPILVLGLTPLEQTDRLLALDVTQTVASITQAQALSQYAEKMSKSLKVHIKVDTGMGRLGFPCDDTSFLTSVREIEQVLVLPYLEVTGIFTHFSVADDEGSDEIAFTERQYQRFAQVIQEVRVKYPHSLLLCHCCNSGGIASYPQWAGDMVRCGILLYGAGRLAEQTHMKATMSLKTRIATVREVPANTPIGYGRSFYTKRKSRIGVVPIGYADGFPRCLSNHFSFWSAYGAVPLCGTICMDMCMVDVTDFPQLDAGDVLEVYGEHQRVEQVAQMAHTIPYELLCSVSKRVPRCYFVDGKNVHTSFPLLDTSSH